MKAFEKPLNSWGWARIAGWSVLAAVLAWTILAALLRAVGGVPWMAWSGFANFTLMRGLEVAVIPLAAALAAGLYEEHEHKTQTELAYHRENQKALAAQRKMVLKRVHEAVHARQAVDESIRAALPELDGKGRGELLHFLFEKHLISPESALDLRGADFANAHLSKARLHGVCLEGVNLIRAQLDGAHLEQSRLSGANLSRAFLRHAKLKESSLAVSDLQGARLEDANLEGADLRGALVKGAFLVRVNLKASRWSGDALELLEEAVLVEAILPDGRAVTNEKGKEYLRKKEIEVLVDRL